MNRNYLYDNISCYFDAYKIQLIIFIFIILLFIIGFFFYKKRKLVKKLIIKSYTKHFIIGSLQRVKAHLGVVFSVILIFGCFSYFAIYSITFPLYDLVFFLLIALTIYLVSFWFKNKRGSNTIDYFKKIFDQFHINRGVILLIFSIFLLISISSSFVELSYNINKINNIAFILTFLAGIATVLSLLNTYFIMHGIESRVYDYNKLLNRLNLDLDRIIKGNQEGKRKWPNEYIYIMSFTPLIGSISGDYELYKIFYERFKIVIEHADTVVIRASEYKKFHNIYLSCLSEYKDHVEIVNNDIAPKSGGDSRKYQLFSEDLKERNDDMQDIVDILKKKNRIDKYDTDLSEFPRFYIYVSRNLTVFCRVRWEPKKGNEIIGIISEDIFYKDFAYEMFPDRYKSFLNRIKP